VTRWLVIPCFNEAKRLDEARILSYTSALQCNVLLVNDGSTDSTKSLIESIISKSNNLVHGLTLKENVGKAEAVRSGLHTAISFGATVVGYTDADGAVSVFDLVRLFEELDLDVGNNGIIGSRVALLGHQITRKPSRHYSGRIFATLAAVILQCSVYDTQCGAKVFRVSPNLKRGISEQFISKWGFDIELIGRLLRLTNEHSAHGLREVPLTSWDDVSGSKLKIFDGLRTFFELLAIRKSLSKWSN
jgi:glycosyltransferase involved in cell wall biosynthesis